MKNLKPLLIPVSLFSLILICCSGKSNSVSLISVENEVVTNLTEDTIPKEIEKYISKHANPDKNSKSEGSVSSGTLTYGYLIPYVGNNFWYFSDESYLAGRAFTNNLVLQSIVDSYLTLQKQTDRRWCIMEASNQKGGTIAPHRTHQNGLSIDFMMPLQKNNKPFYDFDKRGKIHYLMAFDDDGNTSENKDVNIDFDAVGAHILALEKEARNNGLKIKKVIIKIELKDELFASEYGKELEESGIYFVKGLSNLVNALHDDHYHIDFEKL